MSKDIQDSLNAAGSKLGDAVEQAKDKAQDAKDKAHSHFQDFAAMTEDEFSRLYGSDNKMDMLIDFVRDRPVVSLGIAVLAGIILSKLCRCHCKCHKCK